MRDLYRDLTRTWQYCNETAKSIHDEHGQEVTDRFLYVHDGEICTVVPVMPSMLTANAWAMRQDYLC